MDALYHQTNRLIQETQEYFQSLERELGSTESIETEIQSKINAVNINCERLDVLSFKVPVTQRQNAKMRCDQLKYDNRHLQAALRMWQQKRQRKEAEVSERELLLNRRFSPNPETSIEMDQSLLQHNSMQNAHRGVDDMLMTGSNVLDSLRSQRDTLKGAHRRIVDIANTLGLSNATMRLIEKRVVQDKYILIGGIIITCFIIFLVVHFFT